MTKLIDHMLDFARLEMKSGKYAEEAVDMEELVASICSDMKLIREKKIMLDYETEQAVFYGNRELLSRILVNLVSNAYRYGKENGHIFVKLKKEEKIRKKETVIRNLQTQTMYDKMKGHKHE